MQRNPNKDNGRGRVVYIKSFGWPLVQVPQDDFGDFEGVK